MNLGWVACPYCGWQIGNMFNSNLSIMEIVEQTRGSSCSGSAVPKRPNSSQSVVINTRKRASLFARVVQKTRPLSMF